MPLEDPLTLAYPFPAFALPGRHRLRTCIGLAWLLLSAGAAAQQASPKAAVRTLDALPKGSQPLQAAPAASEVAPAAMAPDCGRCPGSEPPAAPLGLLSNDPQAYAIVSVARGLSTHKPMFLLPYSWSPDYDGAESEAIFQFSAKLSVLGSPFYVGYTQRSFWQLYNGENSRLFRTSDYNPELFYRWTPDARSFRHWGMDLGLEHQSNGENLPLSRSWNRLYVAPFHSSHDSALYAKFSYRLPEKSKDDPADPKGDDNPDIVDYYGFAELHFNQQLFDHHLLAMMLRGNTSSGRGAFSLNYSVPAREGYAFWQLYLWHGYGESMLDYNNTVTRLGVGIALSR